MNSVIKRPNHRRNAFFFHPFENLLNELVEGNEAQRSFRPSTNVTESDTAFTIEMAVPGYGKKEISIEMEKNVLTVSADREAGSDEETTYRLREFNYGSFSRSFKLPEDIMVEEIKAVFKNGVLTLTLPKQPESAPRKIDISQENSLLMESRNDLWMSFIPVLRDLMPDEIWVLPGMSENFPASIIEEKENSFIISISIAGFSKKLLNIEILDNALTVFTDLDQKNLDAAERTGFEGFSRTFHLPKIVNTNSISADLKDGILKIHLPKQETALDKNPTKITIG